MKSTALGVFVASIGLAFGVASIASCGSKSSGATTSNNGVTSKVCSGPGVCELAHVPVWPHAIAVDASNIYWVCSLASSTGSGVMKEPLGGGPVTVLASHQGGEDLVLDDTFVYWSGGGADGRAVMKVAKAGGDPVTIAAAESGPFGIAVNASAIYWANFGDSTGEGRAVRTAPLAGGDPSTLVADTYGPGAIALDSSHVYWSDNASVDDAVSVASAPLTGGQESLVAPGGGESFSMVLDGSDLYWADYYHGTINKVSLNGGPIITLATGQTSAGIAVDDTNIYWTSAGDGKTGTVMKMPKDVSLDAGSSTTVASYQGQPWAIAVDANAVYWSDLTGAIFKSSPK